MSGQELGNVRTRRQIMRFAIPTIIVMVSISTYSIADGALVSNMIGTDALAALNIVMPVSALFTSFGFMFSTGGSAYVATKLGEEEGRGQQVVLRDRPDRLSRVRGLDGHHPGFLIAARGPDGCRRDPPRPLP